MQNQPLSDAEARRILSDFGIEYSTKTNFSQLGGMGVLLELLRRGKYHERLTERFGSYKARTVLQFLIGLWAGARTMVEVGQVGQDPLVRRFIGATIEEAQLGRDFRSFSKQEIEDFHDFNISQTIFDLIQKTPQSETLYFDIDATSVEKYGHQEGVEKGYVGSEDPESCYQYLFIYFGNRKTFLHGTIRAGSTHSQNDFCGYLERFLPMLERRWSTVFRADSGYYNERAFDLFSKHAATYFIKSPMSKSRQSFVQTSPALVWSAERSGESYAAYLTKTKAGSTVREIYKRTQTSPLDQMSLFASTEYRYDCLSTNDLTVDEDKAFGIYNQRANIENGIKEFKEDYQLGRIVTENFDANDAIMQATMMAYSLVQLLKNEVLPPKMSRQRLSTLRTHVLNVPACLVHWARKEITRIQNLFLPEMMMAELVRNLRRIKSWMLEPPLLEPSAA